VGTHAVTARTAARAATKYATPTWNLGAKLPLSG
jgi:hypothetical protein